jgi:hypothetical protein
MCTVKTEENNALVDSRMLIESDEINFPMICIMFLCVVSYGRGGMVQVVLNLGLVVWL